MHSDATVFTEMRFWGLVLCSLVLPTATFITLFVRREFSKVTVLGFGLLLILLAGVDIFLLRALATLAQATPSLADDLVFSSALSIALYIFPAAFGTFGLNMVSHVLMHYLKQKELRFERHKVPQQQPTGAPSRTRALAVRRIRPQADRAEEPRPYEPRGRAPRASWLYASPGMRRRRVVSRASLR
ncbi:hypothetical protein [Variovorax sp.]|uniref:hypothetical protein n=1 Tax=Variovorax sp. TaxID=1871043 RepID=UPI003BABD98F